MVQKTLSIIFILVSLVGFSQIKVKDTGYTHFQLKSKKDTIDFVVADTNFSVKKPMFLFCQGSLPVPLFLDFQSEGIFPVPLSNFELSELKKYYHVVVVSMPKTPLLVGNDHLNRSYNYVLDTANEYSYSPAFLEADYLDNYVERANQVVRFLSNQQWVKSDQLVVAGHSQGAHVALEIAATNKKVTQLGLFAFNPLGRIDQYIRALRKQAEAGEISWEQADSIQQTVFEDYKSYYDPVASKHTSFAKSWVSFSKSQLTRLISLKLPIYIAYGSDDINGDFCDLLPLYFIEKGKTNYNIIRYPNLEHNFFPVNENGQPDYQQGKWPEVMNAFVQWTLQATAAK